MAISFSLAVVATATAYNAYETRQASKEQDKVRAEQKAGNKAESMRERRMQIREERIRRAALLQSSEASGTTGSSGEIGSLGALATNLSSNVGMNLGRLQTADNISIFQQNAADHLNRGQTAQAIGQIAGSYVNYSQSTSKTPPKVN